MVEERSDAGLDKVSLARKGWRAQWLMRVLPTKFGQSPNIFTIPAGWITLQIRQWDRRNERQLDGGNCGSSPSGAP